MVDWGSAIELFVSGVVGVMVVMIMLQISIQIFSRIIRSIEKRTGDNKTKVQKSV